ncbi:MAG: trypsin-like peptidase domain-containing protein [Planctomycetaceae bacterium]|nr:trypsin-like peptidase domain-containing protein [Planctomycetaceae bacterium]
MTGITVRKLLVACVLLFACVDSVETAEAQLKAPRQLQTVSGQILVPRTGSPADKGSFENSSQLPAGIYDNEGLTPDEAASVFVYESNNRSVANIATRIGAARVMFMDNPTADAGSGFVIDHEGHVLTNFHVVEDAERIQVTLYNGESYEAEPVGVDPINDMAVVKVNAPADVLYPVRLGDSSRLKVGMKVYAIGNPFGLERTMTTGIISSLNRTLPVTRARSIKSVIQTDAAINPGNSGGPLFNSHGALIGMNTAIASKTGQNSGIGFAIPVNLIRRVVPELIEHGRVIRPDSGILEVMRTEAGLRILRLDPDGAAIRSGLKGPEIRRVKRGFVIFESEDRNAADLIVGVNGKKTIEVDEFLSEVESHRPGDQIRIEVIRDGKQISIPLTLK